MARILVADDEEGVRAFLVDTLQRDGHSVDAVSDGRAALERLETTTYQLLVTDLKMPRLDGVELTRRARSDYPDMEMLVLTAHGSVDTAVECMKLGVFDYLQKPLGSPAALRLIAQRALEHRRLRALEEMTRADVASMELTYGAPAMKPVVDALQKVAPTSATVLLVGESGTGKEVAAKTLHAASPRADRPFVAVNCAALAETLLESELFGHERGAFTGAAERRRGRIELAEGGTFFLDEVAELKPALQAKLLRVLQERRFQRVGGNQEIVADVRWIAATNRDLAQMRDSGDFREDLFHRLAVFPIHLPPLRDRVEDIIPIANALLGPIAARLGKAGLSLTEGAERALLRQRWPGNVRELANMLERAAILADKTNIDAEELFALPGSRAERPRNASPTLAEVERATILEAVARHEGNRRRVAEELGIGVRTLYDKIKRHGIDT